MEVSAKNSNKIFIPLALLLPLCTVWLLTQIQFWFGAVIANPIGILLGFFIGIWIAIKVQFSLTSYKVTFWIFYLIFLLVSTPYIGLLTSCANGDCI